MGGQIVMEFQRLFPHRTAGLVLADTSAQAETEEGKELRDAMADRLLREGMRPYAEAVISKMVAPYNIQALPTVAEHVLGMMRRTSAQGAAAALRGRAERPDYLEVLAQAALPALVVVGRDDEFTPLSDAQLMHDHLAHATLVIIDGAAHMPNLERPDEFNRALERFLCSVARAA
jgi:pimeloyl-ACP methyl ester carboxylesterase